MDCIWNICMDSKLEHSILNGASPKFYNMLLYIIVYVEVILRHTEVIYTDISDNSNWDEHHLSNIYLNTARVWFHGVIVIYESHCNLLIVGLPPNIWHYFADSRVLSWIECIVCFSPEWWWLQLRNYIYIYIYWVTHMSPNPDPETWLNALALCAT